jgi:imidazolonepropionase
VAGIASTVRATAAASVTELLDQSRRRLHALMRGGVTTVEIKSGYGLDPASELRLLNVIRTLPARSRCGSRPPCLRFTRFRLAPTAGAYVDRMIEGPASNRRPPRPLRPR